MCDPGQDSDMIFGSVSHLGWTYCMLLDLKLSLNSFSFDKLL